MEFYELEIWKKGYELLMKVYKVTSKYPKEEKFGLVQQTRDSGNSIIAQIAEACGRYSFADRVRVLHQSRGECFETRSHLMVAFGLNYLEKGDFDFINKEYAGLANGINSFIKSISRYKKPK